MQIWLKQDVMGLIVSIMELSFKKHLTDFEEEKLYKSKLALADAICAIVFPS